jgi:multidrug efflux pump subunit AcrB
VLAALLVLLVISGYYGSLIPSLTVILHIPPPVVAALTVLRLTGTSLSIPVLSGMLVVIGISINNIVVLLPVASGTPCGPSNSPPSLRFAFSEKLPSLLASTATTATGVLPLFIGGLYRAGLPAGLSIVIASGAVSSFLLLFLSCGVFDSLLPRLFFQWRHEGTGPEG